MKKFAYISCCMLLAAIMSGCGNGDVREFDEFFGKQVAYRSDFLWSKYTPDTLKQTLVFEQVEDAFTKPITLGLFEVRDSVSENQESVKSISEPVGKEITLLVNGVPQKGSTFVVQPGTKELELGVVFTRGLAEERDYYWDLKVLDAGDLDMINESLTTIEIPKLLTWEAEYDTEMNPLKELVLWICAIIAALLVLWFAVVRWIVFPTFSFSVLQIAYFEGENRKGREDCTLRGARKVVCDASPKYQSGLNRFFCGRIVYLTNQFWATPVEFTPCGSNGLNVHETVKLGERAAYRMGSMITPQNGPRKPFIVKKVASETEQMAQISIG